MADKFAYLTDFLPSVPDIVGFPMPGDEYKSLALLRTTGKSLLPPMLGEVQRMHGPDEAIGFELSGGGAVFMGGYKLTRNRAPIGDGSWRLINQCDDPTESRDLSTVEPQRLKKMLAEVEAYHQRVGAVLPEAGCNPLRQLLAKSWPVLVRKLWLTLLPAGMIVPGAPLMLWWWLRRRRRAGVAGAGRSA